MQPSCLVVGSPEVGKYTLIRSLQLAPEDKDDSHRTYKLRLDTKYYTANVLAQSVSTECELSPDSQVEAVVLVFAANQQSSFDEIRSWAEKQDTESIEVKLVVANKADTLQQASSGLHRPAWLEDAMNWCYDGCYEYIETAASCPEVDAALQLDDEQQGVARLLAALQAHMWPGMVLKQWSPGLPAAAALATGSSCIAGGNKSDTDQGSKESATLAADADVLLIAVVDGSNAMQQETSQAQQQQQAQQPQKQQGNSGEQQSQQPADLESVSANIPEQQLPTQQQSAIRGASPAVDVAAFGNAEAEVELEMDDFEKLMRQVQGMRTRLSGLPDADRRAAAAEMALKLASLMGLGDEEAGSSEEEDVLQRDVH